MNQKLIDYMGRLEGLIFESKIRDEISLSDVNPTDKREYLNELVMRSIDDDDASDFGWTINGFIALDSVKILDDQIVQILSDYHQRTRDHKKIMCFMDKIFKYISNNPTAVEGGIKFSLRNFEQNLLPYTQSSVLSKGA